MDLQREIQMRSTVKAQTESNLRQVYRTVLALRDAGDESEKVKGRYDEEYDACVLHFSKASLQEISGRLLALPRELRDVIYEYLWDFESHNSDNFKTLIFLADFTTPPPSCSGPLGTVPSCTCFTHVSHFLDSGIMDKQVVLEILGIFHTRMKKGPPRRSSSYTLEWGDVEAFAARDILHLGLTLHGVLTNHRLRINFDCLDEPECDGVLETIGVPGGVHDQLQRTADALSRLCLESPRTIQFDFEDYVDGVPTKMEYVFRTLSEPFHRLKQHGFDVRVSYEHKGEYMFDDNNCGYWDLGEDGWESSKRSDVWQWGLLDWKLNFSRANSWFQPQSSGLGGNFVPNPNGPIPEECFDDYRRKMPVWEGIRRYLYRYQPDIEEVITWTRSTEGWYRWDCGCASEKHTCSEYFLCVKHNGWKYRRDGLDLACWKCDEGAPFFEFDVENT
ncbi:uncharacterized protein K460DRAFT_420769 [Cucurbitaria berberidis CBS 394.84]|uniref:Uncharacterized protein n=1 Tax=Cucurbitaria berberidis CBS 394.84 TaxID=1168544 RepID=A0A9P4G8E2_9PLEO|nr:uncharacterized protein K460DRAFT_420769 [Cucurbitaria berberidis CBS 394.84]KAF1840931.1 hypothetical protein K460DRAFT_420769 [Cucurbitaria berberidis CBS 394.84]